MRPLTEKESLGFLKVGDLLLVDARKHPEPYQEIIVVTEVRKTEANPLVMFQVIAANKSRVFDSDRDRVGITYYHCTSEGAVGGMTYNEINWATTLRNMFYLERSDLPLYMDWYKGKEFEGIFKG
jgi:hypothetical protein